MKIYLVATTALALTGSAFAQTYSSDVQTTASTNPPAVTFSIDPTVAISPPATWTTEQVALWEEQMGFHPGWTAAQRAAFEAMMGIPPVNWTAEQRTLYQQHLGHIPTHWTATQRTMFETQVAGLRTPWMSVTQSAAATTSTTGATTLAAASGRIVQPSNASPELDARGIAVISDPAVVPDGYNGFAGTGMGGPLVDPATGEAIDAADDNYPACTATVTDNCIQLYERGVRDSLASWNRSTGGLRDDSSMTGVGGPVGEDEVGDNTPEDDVLDVDIEPDGDIDVDGDLDNDGDNDLE